MLEISQAWLLTLIDDGKKEHASKISKWIKLG